MQQEKEEAQARKRALAEARAEVAMLGQLVRLAS